MTDTQIEFQDVKDPIFTLKSDLIQAGIKPNRLKGQNFLISPVTRDRIAETGKNLPGKNILEIGPGTGILTWALLKIGLHITVIELEPTMAQLLRTKFRNVNLQVLEMDAMEYLRTQEPPAETADTKLICNLPYAISSPVVLHLARFSESYSGAVILLQKEVVERIAAPPGDSNRCALSVLVQHRFVARRVFNVKATQFQPPPKVASAVVELKNLNKTPDVPWNAFEKTVYGCFSQRRKTIFNNLRKTLQIKNVDKLLKTAGIEKHLRPQDLPVSDFETLAALIQDDNYE